MNNYSLLPYGVIVPTNILRGEEVNSVSPLTKRVILIAGKIFALCWGSPFSCLRGFVGPSFISLWNFCHRDIHSRDMRHSNLRGSMGFREHGGAIPHNPFLLQEHDWMSWDMREWQILTSWGQEVCSLSWNTKEDLIIFGSTWWIWGMTVVLPHPETTYPFPHLPSPEGRYLSTLYNGGWVGTRQPFFI